MSAAKKIHCKRLINLSAAMCEFSARDTIH